MKHHIFVDLDGVLADFDTLAMELFGCHPRQFEDKHGEAEFWRKITEHGTFYADLPVMPDARELWDACCRYGEPTVLTGVPRGDWAAPQKRGWVERHFGHGRVITCASRNKRDHAMPGDILIDDWLKYRALWEEMGGIFIHHVNAKNSIAELARHFT